MFDIFKKILKIVYKRIYGIFVSILFLILSYYLFFELNEDSLNKTGGHYKGRLFDSIFLKIENQIPNSLYFFSLVFFSVGCYFLYIIIKRIIFETKEISGDKKDSNI